MEQHQEKHESWGTSSSIDSAAILAPESDTILPDPQHSRPRTRQRLHKPATPLDVPDINDDAAERKRVLNVLAQRRYRDRKRQSKRKNLALEITDAAKNDCRSSHDGISRQRQPDNENLVKSAAVRTETGSHATSEARVPVSISSLSQPSPQLEGWTMDLSDLDMSQAVLKPTLLQLDSSASETPNSYSSLDMTHLSSEDEAILAVCAATDPACLLGWSNPSDFPETSEIASSSSWSSSSSRGVGNLGNEGDFPDSYLLPVTELILLRACTRIGERIQCCNRMWQIDANSSFNDGTMTSLATSMLPLSWQPTKSQSTIPHHPIVDLMPWPSVRDRLLLIMTLPDSQKPASLGAGPMAVAQLAYDMEDSSEGLRVWGGDVYDPMAWEVGQVMFEKWWFVFDRQVVDRSNYWRRMRGAPELRMPSRIEEVQG